MEPSGIFPKASFFTVHVFYFTRQRSEASHRFTSSTRTFAAFAISSMEISILARETAISFLASNSPSWRPSRRPFSRPFCSILPKTSHILRIPPCPEHAVGKTEPVHETDGHAISTSCSINRCRSFACLLSAVL